MVQVTPPSLRGKSLALSSYKIYISESFSQCARARGLVCLPLCARVIAIITGNDWHPSFVCMFVSKSEKFWESLDESETKLEGRKGV